MKPIHKMNHIDRINLRLAALETIRDCEDATREPADYDDVLAGLFGCVDYMHLSGCMLEDTDLCRRVALLSGPDAVAIYKTMRARSDAV